MFYNIITLCKHLRYAHFDRRQIELLKEKKFRQLLHYAWKKSNFYRNYYLQHGIKQSDLTSIPISDLPTINKSILSENLDSIFTTDDLRRDEIERYLNTNDDPHDIYKNKYIILHTSGSTSKPSIVVYKDKEWVYSSMALSVRVSEIRYSIFRRIKLSYIGAIHGHFTGACYAAHVPKILFENQLLSILKPINEIVRELNEFQPDQLIGYSTVITQLANEAIAGRLKIVIEKVGTSGEPLTLAMVEKIKLAWGIDPVNTYISTETLLYGCQFNFNDNFILYDDLNYTELNKNSVKNNSEDGLNIIVTNLFNYTTPLIRFESTDLVTPCEQDDSNPFFQIKKLNGRSYDPVPITLNTLEIDEINPIVLVEVFVAGLKQIQFISRSNTLVEILYVSEGDISQDLNNKISQILKEKNADKETRFTVKQVPYIKPEPNGKTPLIKLERN